MSSNNITNPLVNIPSQNTPQNATGATYNPLAYVPSQNSNASVTQESSPQVSIPSQSFSSTQTVNPISQIPSYNFSQPNSTYNPLGSLSQNQPFGGAPQQPNAQYSYSDKVSLWKNSGLDMSNFDLDMFNIDANGNMYIKQDAFDQQALQQKQARDA